MVKNKKTNASLHGLIRCGLCKGAFFNYESGYLFVAIRTILTTLSYYVIGESPF